VKTPVRTASSTSIVNPAYAADSIDSISADLVAKDPPLVTTITDAGGKPIAYLFDQYRIPTGSNQISPTMKAALIMRRKREMGKKTGRGKKNQSTFSSIETI